MTVGELIAILQKEPTSSQVVSYDGGFDNCPEVCVSRDKDGSICISAFRPGDPETVVLHDGWWDSQ